jgi:hypothetical protein
MAIDWRKVMIRQWIGYGNTRFSDSNEEYLNVFYIHFHWKKMEEGHRICWNWISMGRPIAMFCQKV